MNVAGRARLSASGLGLLFGLAAVAMWGVYLATTRAGIASGLHPVDLVVLRYGPAALLMLPWFLRAPGTLGGVGWGRGLWLAACAGPVFIALAAGGYLWAPLAHGAVIQPSTAAMASIALAALVLRERVPLARWLGAGVIVSGIALIGLGGGGETVRFAQTWPGDAMFVASGLLWGLFTVSIRRWNVDGTAATGAVAIVSAALVLPLVALFGTYERVLALTWPDLLMQMLVHGVLSGVLAIVCFGHAVRLLGAARGALFPALVPAATLLAGIPIAEAVPGPLEWTGALLATLGLAIAMGTFGGAFGGTFGSAFGDTLTRFARRPPRRAPRRRGHGPRPAGTGSTRPPRRSAP